MAADFPCGVVKKLTILTNNGLAENEQGGKGWDSLLMESHPLYVSHDDG